GVLSRHDLVIALKPCVPAGQLIVFPPITTLNAAGADQRLSTRSGWVYSMPVSVTATTIDCDPVEISHASVALMSAPETPETPPIGCPILRIPHSEPKLVSLGTFASAVMM